jgi:hypothetical protein
MTEQGRPYRDYFDNEYLKGDALPDGGRTYTITGKARIMLEDQHKLALELDTGDKWLANITNCAYMTRIFGTNIVADWVGHQVTLAFDPSVKFGKDTVGGIRVIGSPELDGPLSFDFQENSRKKPRRVTLQHTKTGQKQANPAPLDDMATTGPDGGQNGPAPFFVTDGEG